MSVKVCFLAVVSIAAAFPSFPWPSWGTGKVQPFVPVFNKLFGGPLTPQILKTFEEPNIANIARNSYIVREGSELKLNGDRYTASGANVYWLGLDENVIPPAGQPFYAPFNASYPTLERISEVMKTLVTMGAKTIRSQTLGVSTGNPLSLMPDLGVVNQEAFKTIDWSVYQARQHGLRLVIPLTDSYDYYHGGKYNFLRWRGINITQSENSPRVLEFYTNRQVINDFKDYIKILMTHKNQYTGLTYAEDPTIMAYETGNELYGNIWGDMNVPAAWVKEIAQYIKELGPHKLVVDGTYGINKTHLPIKEVDIFSDHFYPINITKLTNDIDLVASVDRVYWAGEIDWTGLNGKGVPTGDSLESFYKIIEDAQKKEKPVVIGDVFWSLFMHNAPDCETFVQHNDGFAMQYGDPKNSDYINKQIGLSRQHFFKMQGIEVDGYLPAVPCPHNFIPGYDSEYTYY